MRYSENFKVENRSMMLNEDVWFKIFNFLWLKDLYNLMQTNKTLSFLIQYHLKFQNNCLINKWFKSDNLFKLNKRNKNESKLCIFRTDHDIFLKDVGLFFKISDCVSLHNNQSEYHFYSVFGHFLSFEGTSQMTSRGWPCCHHLKKDKLIVVHRFDLIKKIYQDFYFDCSDVSNILFHFGQIEPIDSLVEQKGRCRLCEKYNISSTLPSALEYPSYGPYIIDSIVMLNKKDTIRVLKILNNRFVIFENGEKKRYPKFDSSDMNNYNDFKIVNSEIILLSNDDCFENHKQHTIFLINLVSGEKIEFQCNGFDYSCHYDFVKKGPFILYGNKDNWKNFQIIRDVDGKLKCHLTDLENNGAFPVFCKWENRLFFL